MNADPDLLAHFMTYFEIVRVDTPSLLEEVFRLRYEVYCREGRLPGFDPRDYPDAMERDVYDRRSVHCLLRHRPSGVYAGTVRLVLADLDRPDAPFPVEVAAGAQMDLEYLRTRISARHRLGECSRFMLARQFRSRRGEQHWPDGVAEPGQFGAPATERRAHTHPVLGLIKAGLTMSWERSVTDWYMAMEPRLDRRLRQFGLVLPAVSPRIEYHGSCRAHWTRVPHALEYARSLRGDVWSLLTNDGAIWPIGGTAEHAPVY